MYQHMIHVQCVEASIGVLYALGNHKDVSPLYRSLHSLNHMLAPTAQNDIQLVKAVGMVTDGVVSVYEGFYIFVLLSAEAVRMTPMCFSLLFFHIILPMIRFYPMFELVVL